MSATWITFVVAEQGNVWVGTNKGLIKCQNGAVTPYATPSGLPDAYTTAIHVDHNANVWVGTQSSGISRLAAGKWTSYSAADGLTNNRITSITEDHEGSLWVSTMAGLNQFRDVNIVPYTTKQGLASNNVSGGFDAADGSMYFLSAAGASITRLNAGQATVQAALVGSVFTSRDGSQWIGQNGSLTNFKDGKLKTFGLKDGLPLKWISAITEDSESLILFLDHIGLQRFVDGQLKPYLLRDGQQYAASEYAIVLYSAPDGILWLGTTGGLVKIEKGRSTAFGVKDGMAKDWVNFIYDDGNGSLWLASTGAGLTRFRNGKFTVFNTSVGLFNNEIYSVLGDDQGDLLLGSPAGIGRLSRNELDDFEAGRNHAIHTQVYTTADGMKADECFIDFEPAAWKTRSGRLWFATTKGAVMIDPKAFKQNAHCGHDGPCAGR